MKISYHNKKVKYLLRKLIFPGSVLFILITLDLFLDIKQKDSFEVLTEFITYGLIVYIAYVGLSFYKLDKRAMESASQNIDATKDKLDEAEQQKKRLQEGINANMQEAFANWKLTPAESAVSALILKGFSFSEIADFRGTSERTIRDQAASIYRKAKVKNRIELTAYFVEDLL